MKKLLLACLLAATQVHAAVVVVARPVVVAPRPVVTAPRPATPPPKVSSTPPRTASTPFIWPAWIPFVGSRCHDDKECKK